MSDTTFTYLSPTEAEVAFPDLFYSVFGYTSPAALPGMVITIHRASVLIGFASLYLHDANTIYIQYAGSTSRSCLTLSVFRALTALLHQTYPFILGRILNTNTRAIQVALSTGFRIIGTRQATDGSLYLEILSSKE